MLGRLCDYDFRALAAVYNINCVHVSNSYIKSAVWSSFAECLYKFCVIACVCENLPFCSHFLL